MISSCALELATCMYIGRHSSRFVSVQVVGRTLHCLSDLCIVQVSLRCTHLPFPMYVVYTKPSLVPRPSASRARTSYVTFEPLSDSYNYADKGSKVTYAMRA